jgi:hypothetical protein
VNSKKPKIKPPPPIISKNPPKSFKPALRGEPTGDFLAELLKKRKVHQGS